MPDYICNRCLKQFKKKSHLVQHTEHKKVPCIPYNKNKNKNKNIGINIDNETVDEIKYEHKDIDKDNDVDTVDEYSSKDKNKNYNDNEDKNYNDNEDINLKFINLKYKYSNKYILIQKQQLNILKKIEIQEQLYKYLLKDFLDLRLEFNRIKSI
jgi:hypothetical protein